MKKGLKGVTYLGKKTDMSIEQTVLGQTAKRYQDQGKTQSARLWEECASYLTGLPEMIFVVLLVSNRYSEISTSNLCF